MEFSDFVAAIKVKLLANVSISKLELTDKQRKTVLAIIIALGVFLISFLTYSIYVNKYTKVFKGISINGTNVDSLTIDELKEQLEKKYSSNLENLHFNISVNTNLYKINYQDVDIKYNINKIASEAFNTDEIRIYSPMPLIIYILDLLVKISSLL